MKTRPVAVALLLFALHVSAAAQTFFHEVLDVRITNVDVIVTGKDGKPVPGLTRDDFELYEDGVKKEITNFLEIREDAAAKLKPETASSPEAAPAASDVRRRVVAILFDNAALKPSSRAAVLPHLEAFLQKNIRPGDEVALMSWNSSLKLELESTSDRNAITEAVRRVGAQTARGSDVAREREDFYRSIAESIRIAALLGQQPKIEDALSHARSYGMWSVHHAQQRAEALKSVIASLRGQPGRKVVVFVTEAFSSNPAEWAFAYLGAIRETFEGNTSTIQSDAREFEIPDLVSGIAATANSSGVTLYTIDGAGKETDARMPDASQTVRVTERVIALTPTEAMTLQGIAANTGGVALTGSTNWQLAFDTIASDLDTYYSLGYKASGEQQDQLKTLEVRVKNKKHKVRARHAVIEPSVFSEMNDAVAANLFRDLGRNDLSIKASAAEGNPGFETGTTIIPVTVTIPTDKLTLLPNGTDLVGSFSLFAAFLRDDGRVSKVAQQPHSFRFPAESLSRRKEITVKLNVTTDSNTDGISIGVMDEATRATGFASVKLATN